MDYSAQFTQKWSWYVRSEVGRDALKDLKLYNIDAAGIGRDFIKTDKQTLTGRLGLAYRYESYGGGNNLSTAGLDTGLIHTYVSWIGKLSNQITYVPAFSNFANYRIQHESSLEMPLAVGEWWKVRLGVSNDYSSKPVKGLKRLDTTYFARLVLSWR